MSTIKYVGRTTDFKGKTLWEIVGNLKDFGVGRMVIRNMFQRYPEPCFMRILKVQALPNDDPRKVRVTVEKTFRGRILPRSVEICSASYKADYQLIRKADEAKFSQITSPVQEKILPRTLEMPPLLKEFVVEETGNPNPVLITRFRNELNNVARLANEGETPTVELTIGLGKPASPKLYENISL